MYSKQQKVDNMHHKFVFLLWKFYN